MATKESSKLPREVVDVLKTETIGYLSVKSEKGDLYTYPVAFLFAGNQAYTMTPITAAKLRFMRANPDVSFLIKNKGLTLGAVGVMFQGRAKVYSIAKTVSSILSIGPNMAKYAKKYPDQFFFYARESSSRTSASSTSTGSFASSPRRCSTGSGTSSAGTPRRRGRKVSV